MSRFLILLFFLILAAQCRASVVQKLTDMAPIANSDPIAETQAMQQAVNETAVTEWVKRLQEKMARFDDRVMKMQLNVCKLELCGCPDDVLDWANKRLYVHLANKLEDRVDKMKAAVDSFVADVHNRESCPWGDERREHLADRVDELVAMVDSLEADVQELEPSGYADRPNERKGLLEDRVKKISAVVYSLLDLLEQKTLICVI